MGRIQSLFPVLGVLRTSRSRIFIFGTVLYAALTLLFASDSLAQSDIKILGQVIDSESGAPIPGATITIEGLGRSTSSDQAGRFAFSGLPDGRYTLRAGRVGYRRSSLIEIDVKPDLPLSLNISLRPEPIRVADQAVSAPRPEPLHAVRAGNVTRLSIDPGELESIEDLVRVVPELELVGSGGRRFLRLRGSQANAVLIMLDGRIQNSALTSTGDLTTIPLASVSGVEVTRGADLGSPGLAGSVNFITETAARSDKISTSAGRGSFGHESYSANLFKNHRSSISGGLDIASAFTRGEFEYTDPRGQTQRRENNYSRDRKIFGQAGFAGDGFSLEVRGRYFERRSGIPGPVFQFTPLALSRDFEREAYVIADKKMGERFEIRLNGGLLSRTINYDSPVTPTSFIPYSTRFSEQSRDLKIEVSRDGPVGLNGVASIRRESLDGADFIRPTASFGSHARDIAIAGLGSQIAIPEIRRFSKGSSVNFGLRVERAEGRTFWGPSLAARLNLNLPAQPGLDLTFFRSQRLPGLTDLYWKEDVFATPNPGLKPERSTGYEIGMEIKPVRSWQSAFRITRFETRYNDIIVWRRWGGDKFKPVNLSAALIDGWEIAASVRPFAGPITVSWNSSILSPQNRERNTVYFGKYLTYRPIGSRRAGLELRLGRLRASISGRHIGRRYMTEENTKSLPPVDIFDLAFEYVIGFKAFEAKLSFDVLNAGDRRYEILERIPEKPREIKAKIEISKLWEEI